MYDEEPIGYTERNIGEDRAFFAGMLGDSGFKDSEAEDNECDSQPGALRRFVDAGIALRDALNRRAVRVVNSRDVAELSMMRAPWAIYVSTDEPHSADDPITDIYLWECAQHSLVIYQDGGSWSISVAPAIESLAGSGCLEGTIAGDADRDEGEEGKVESEGEAFESADEEFDEEDTEVQDEDDPEEFDEELDEEEDEDEEFDEELDEDEDKEFDEELDEDEDEEFDEELDEDEDEEFDEELDEEEDKEFDEELDEDEDEEFDEELDEDEDEVDPLGAIARLHEAMIGFDEDSVRIRDAVKEFVSVLSHVTRRREDIALRAMSVAAAAGSLAEENRTLWARAESMSRSLDETRGLLELLAQSLRRPDDQV